jgi:hypothetical protein
VVLGCTPPAASLMTCSFNPSVLQGGSGSSILTITTTAPKAMLEMPWKTQGGGISLAALSVATLLLGLLLPGNKRVRSLMLAVAASMVLFTSFGCLQSSTAATTGTTTTTSSPGTPQGTQLLTITTSGTNGLTTERHNSQFQVTVQ